MLDSGSEFSLVSHGRTWEAAGAVEPLFWVEIMRGCTWHALGRTG